MGKINHIRVPIYLTPGEYFVLERYAQIQGRSKSDVMREMLKNTWECWKEELSGEHNEIAIRNILGIAERDGELPERT